MIFIMYIILDVCVMKAMRASETAAIAVQTWYSAAVRVFQNDLFGEDNKHNDALAEFHQGVDLHERSPTSSGTPTRWASTTSRVHASMPICSACFISECSPNLWLHNPPLCSPRTFKAAGCPDPHNNASHAITCCNLPAWDSSSSYGSVAAT